MDNGLVKGKEQRVKGGGKREKENEKLIESARGRKTYTQKRKRDGKREKKTERNRNEETKNIE